VSPVEDELDAVARRSREHEEEEARRTAAADDARLGERPARKPAEAGAGAARCHAGARSRTPPVKVKWEAKKRPGLSAKRFTHPWWTCDIATNAPCYQRGNMGKAKQPAAAGAPPRSASWLTSRQRKKCWRLSVFVLLPITLAFLVAFLAAPEPTPLSSAGATFPAAQSTLHPSLSTPLASQA
jgi:hypothetical protein